MTTDRKHIVIWLSITAFMVFAMAVIGAITRLTESGLSMVEWRPLIGALPPINEEEWLRVFALYKESPEFAQQHSWMALGDFKKIFFWEWFHRLWGRTIGLVYALPLLYFWIRKMIPAGFHARLFFLFILGGGQGVMGWYMVQSGLIDVPSVSHYRLAAHLFLAVILFTGLVWTALDLKMGQTKWTWDNFCLKRHGLVSLGFLFTTIIWGAFVAGLDGGMVYNTWPMMGGEWIPTEVGANNTLHSDPVVVQFFHRWIAMLSGLVIFAYALRVKSWALSGMIFLQIGLGISTLLTQVWIPLAALHQAGALILLTLLLKSMHSRFEKSE
ncbi:MAG: COX15/CtaA family protein [Alphaproteobacteria bacterium]|nr:COX15/CtaA family protein [Alphaproteobacteria bacterium]